MVLDPLEASIECLDEGFVLYDADDRLVACNPRYRDFYGLSELACRPGTPWLELLRTNVAQGRYAEAAGREADFIAERVARRGSQTGSYELKLADGRWLRATDRRTRDGGTVSVRADITEQKLVEARLREAERQALETQARQVEIVAANPVPMTITRVSDGLVVYANQRAADMVRTPLERLIGARSIDFYAEARDRDTVVRLLREKGEVELMEVRFHRGDGSTFPLALICRPILYAGDPCIVSGFHDLSDWKRLEGALHQSEKMAALGSLLAGVAHELNNPLTVVVAQSAMLEEMATSPADAQRATRIRVAAERCSRIVRTFLSLARQRETTPSTMQLNEVVVAAVDLLGYQLRSYGITLQLALDPDLPTLWADADQMNQVVTNLVVNSAQALADRPQPRHVTVATAIGPTPDRLTLTVADNGPGVSPEIRTRIFEPFFTTKEPGTGTGIGLSMCLNMINAHHGSIGVRENDGGGAMFEVVLPRSAAGDTTPDPSPTTPPSSGGRILVVDDEPDIVQTLVELLGADGHEVSTAQHGADALDRLARQHFDAVISDLRMPVMDGPGLYDAIEVRHPRMIRRIGFMTGDSLSDAMRKFLTRTDVACLEKPFARDGVRRLVQRLLQAEQA